MEVVEETSVKEGLSPESTSLIAIEPVTVEVEESSVREPVEVAVITEPSLEPLMVMVMVCVELSVAVSVKASVRVSPEVRALTVELLLLRV